MVCPPCIAAFFGGGALAAYATSPTKWTPKMWVLALIVLVLIWWLVRAIMRRRGCSVCK